MPPTSRSASTRSSSPVPRFARGLIGDLGAVRTMLELGNKRTGDVAWKGWFESLGILHVSVDLNGKDGALALDLTHDLDIGQYDLVTNFGTTEHVVNQKAVWRNIHRACKGRIVSATPAPGYWIQHGRFYPAMRFYVAFADLNGYVIERLFEDVPNKLICARLLKRDRKPYRHPDPSTIFVNETGRRVGMEDCR